MQTNSTMNGMLITQDHEMDSTKSDDTAHVQKMIYNHTVDAFTMIEKSKGFLCANVLNVDNQLTSSIKPNPQIVGVYCVRWRRAGEPFENESKLLVHCIEIVEAPLNLYCFLDEKMYVKVPMTLKITLRNVTNSTIHLKSCLKNADNFMFAGHSQVSSVHRDRVNQEVFNCCCFNPTCCVFFLSCSVCFRLSVQYLVDCTVIV